MMRPRSNSGRIGCAFADGHGSTITYFPTAAPAPALRFEVRAVRMGAMETVVSSRLLLVLVAL